MSLAIYLLSLIEYIGHEEYHNNIKSYFNFLLFVINKYYYYFVALFTSNNFAASFLPYCWFLLNFRQHFDFMFLYFLSFARCSILFSFWPSLFSLFLFSRIVTRWADWMTFLLLFFFLFRIFFISSLFELSVVNSVVLGGGWISIFTSWALKYIATCPLTS